MKYYKIITPIAIVAAIVALYVTTGSGKVESGYVVGDLARDFKLKDVTGKQVSLSDYKNAKGFIVIFTCNSCPISQMYEDRIITLNEKYESKGYPVIAINPNDPLQQPSDSFDKMKERSKEKEFNFPYLFDETQVIATAYGASRTPHVFLLNKETDGNRVKYIGAIDNNLKDGKMADKKYVEEAVEAVMRGDDVSTTITKAIGCTIKWKRS